MEEVEVQSVGGGAAVAAVTVVTALTAVAAVIDSGGREAGVPAVKLLAGAVTARAPRERLTRLGVPKATTTPRLHARATSILMILMCNQRESSESTMTVSSHKCKPFNPATLYNKPSITTP